jgi:translation initiation factor 5B
LKRKEASTSAVFPCVLRTIQIFHARDPIVLGVDVVEGSIRVGTPIAAVKINETTKERVVYSLGKMYRVRISAVLTLDRLSSKIINRWKL